MKSLNEWKIFQNSKSAEIRRIAYLDNPHRIMDNVARLSNVLLFGFTAFILITGGIFHYEMFSLSMGNGALSIGFALGFFVIIEVLKIVLGRQLLRGLFTGDAGESKIHAAAYIIMFCLTVFGFWWSWEISTNAAPTLNKVINFAEGKSNHTNEDEAKRLTAEIAAIDAQITAATQSEQTGFSIRYKGVVTQEGQKIANKAASVKQRLTDQRAALLDRLNGEKDRTRSLNETQLSSAANQLGQYGGFAEILQGIFLLLAGLCEVISYMKNKKDLAEGKISGFQHHPPISNKDINQNPALNEKRGIGFRYGENKESTPTPSVPKAENETPIPVITENVTVITDETENDAFAYGDKILKGLKQEANTDICNWNNQNGTPNAIRERLKKRVQELDKAIREVKSSKEVRQMVCDYFADNVEPITRTTIKEFPKKGSKEITP